MATDLEKPSCPLLGVLTWQGLCEIILYKGKGHQDLAQKWRNTCSSPLTSLYFAPKWAWLQQWIMNTQILVNSPSPSWIQVFYKCFIIHMEDKVWKYKRKKMSTTANIKLREEHFKHSAMQPYYLELWIFSHPHPTSPIVVRCFILLLTMGPPIFRVFYYHLLW